ncbi:MAG: hypothetical protein DSO01_01555 [Archaeoglobi archaeon]|jgi:hypothetical protein|nr:MAG: hypothetical protein DSN99_04760 [Archaeoglobi archaeon]TDA28027.1 MAG: hypothetical protein DSO01_01555 [Archaeoglobi archaeon]
MEEIRFHNLSAYKAYVLAFLANKISQADEKTRDLLSELIQRTESLRSRDLHRFIARILRIQEQTKLDLSTIIPTPEEVQQIMQYPS